MKFLFLYVSIVGVAFFSCGDSQSTTNANGVSNDTVTLDIPQAYRENRFAQRWDEQLRKALKLDSLQKGFDSLQIRVLIDCNSNMSNIIKLERKSSGWNAVFYSFKMQLDDTRSIEVTNLVVESRLPKSGWENFADSLIKTGILDLPDLSKFLLKYNLPNDADGVQVEIGTSKKYRLYQYLALGMNTHIREGPWRLHKALELIEREFNYKRPCEDSINVYVP